MEKYPGKICTIMDETVCESCPLKTTLKCRFTRGHLFRFLVPAFAFILSSGTGMIIYRQYWQTAAWVLFMVIFFTLWEIRVLCSHCPYYAEEANTLHCIANYGSPKVWKYHPEPMSLSDEVQFMIGLGFFSLWNLPWLIQVEAWLFSTLHIITLIGFFVYLTQRVCPHCVNFSCPLNRVAKPIVDAYLQRNPIMRKAWENKGYPFSEES